ncbi:MAG TPA: oxidoreductase C-terminal domain-containing protein [Ilumatobacteraceae bacterium]|nr:oxidoreductase C-terminal domain-containing protein [Ilumatobacteraceae bacterium]
MQRDGVVCDASLRALGTDGAAIPGVYAAGDIARWPNGAFGGEEMRVEHWTTTSEQARHVAEALIADSAGQPVEPFVTVPFFWSDQYDRRIQFLGRAGGDDEVRVVAGSVESRSFVALYGRDGRVRGALGVSMPKQLMRARALVAEGVAFDEALAAAAAWS